MVRQKESETVITVECLLCQKTRDIREGEISEDDFPVCNVCYMPMMPKEVGEKTSDL